MGANIVLMLAPFWYIMACYRHVSFVIHMPELNQTNLHSIKSESKKLFHTKILSYQTRNSHQQVTIILRPSYFKEWES